MAFENSTVDDVQLLFLLGKPLHCIVSVILVIVIGTVGVIVLLFVLQFVRNSVRKHFNALFRFIHFFFSKQKRNNERKKKPFSVGLLKFYGASSFFQQFNHFFLRAGFIFRIIASMFIFFFSCAAIEHFSSIPMAPKQT